MTIVPIVIGALGSITKDFESWMDKSTTKSATVAPASSSVLTSGMVDPRASLSAVQGMPVQSPSDPPFVVGPGFQPIPAKTVAAVVMGE